MTRKDCRVLRSAALELTFWAATLNPEKCGNAERAAVERWQAKHMLLATRLRVIANEEQAKLPKKAVLPKGKDQ